VVGPRNPKDVANMSLGFAGPHHRLAAVTASLHPGIDVAVHPAQNVGQPLTRAGWPAARSWRSRGSSTRL